MKRPPSRSLIQFMSVILPISPLSLVAKAATVHSCKNLVNAGTWPVTHTRTHTSMLFASSHLLPLCR